MMLRFLWLVFAGLLSCSTANASADRAREIASFNQYILLAVEKLATERGALGYANSAYTQDLQLGVISMPATDAPFTMCVAAQMEVIVMALNLYVSKTGDKKPLTFLPAAQWTRLEGSNFK